MIQGFKLDGGSSNDAEFFDGSEPEDTLCLRCKCCINEHYVPKFLDVSKSKKYDVAYTHDLHAVFSERFVSFCKDVLNSDDVFTPIKTPHSTLYYMIPKRILSFDAEKGKVKFGNTCPTCGQCEEIIGANPVYLISKEPLGPHFYRTDLSFSGRKNKHPLILVCTEWKTILAAEKFRGLTFDAIAD
jgi:hypothetical protein